MNLIPTKHASDDLVDAFLVKNPEINKHALLTSGHVVEIKGKIIGCFILERMEADLYWLKQLYITKSAAAKLPLLVETILVLAKKNEAKEVYVHSHQPMIDILLEALQFHQQETHTFLSKLQISKGRWWLYRVS